MTTRSVNVCWVRREQLKTVRGKVRQKYMNVLKNRRHEYDKMLFQFYFNYIIIPKLVKISPVYKPLERLKLKWDDTESLSITEYIEAINKLAYTFEFDHEEVAKKTGLPIIGQKKNPGGEQQGGTLPNQPQTDPQKKKTEPDDETVTSPVMEAGEYDFSSIIGRVMKQVYERKVKTGNIDGELLRKTYEELNKKAAEGWGEDDYNDRNRRKNLNGYVTTCSSSPERRRIRKLRR